MRITVVTIFPDMFKFITEFGIVKRAIDSGILDFEVVNLRDYTTDKHRTTDDYQYGGGSGMVMMVEPIVALSITVFVPISTLSSKITLPT